MAPAETERTDLIIDLKGFIQTATEDRAHSGEDHANFLSVATPRARNGEAILRQIQVVRIGVCGAAADRARKVRANDRYRPVEALDTAINPDASGRAPARRCGYSQCGSRRRSYIHEAEPQFGFKTVSLEYLLERF